MIWPVAVRGTVWSDVPLRLCLCLLLISVCLHHVNKAFPANIRPSVFSPLSNQYQSSSTAVLELGGRQKCSKSLQEEISSGKQIHCRKHHHCWLEDKWVEREGKNWSESCLLSPTLLLAPAKSRKPVSTWSVADEILIPVIWLCSSLWCTCGHVEHFRRLLAQKSFFVVHVLCTCLLAFSLSSLSAICYRICFDMEVVWLVIYKPPNY